MLIPVILCGGAGSRLWPVSRETHPKPFMKLTDGQSLLQKTYLRAAALPDVQHVVTVTNRELFFKTEDEYADVSTDAIDNTYLLEPFGRNTAAAVAAAALQVQRVHGDDALLLVLPADHLISDQAALHRAVDEAMHLARDGFIVTFGIRPSRPDTGFGYIEHEGYTVKRFVEKPGTETAQEYLRSGRFLWNSGMFCFKAGVMLREMTAKCPEILEATRTCLATARIATGIGATQVEFNAACFAQVPDNSLDYAVMETTQLAAVVPCEIGWSDIGSWNAVSDLAAPDADGNRVNGRSVLHDSQNCFIQSERLVGVVGMQDVVIIDTADALLVAHSNRTQDVKHVYAKLKAMGDDTHKLHRTVHRPWGNYSVLQDSLSFKIKRIEVKPGAALSLQMHHHRSEHWIVVTGTAIVVNGDAEVMLQTNQSTYIPAGHKHRLKNPGVIDLVMIEVQSGQYLGEDDIVRFEDQYGRA
ncbi:MAG: mannose-1-phosphate guanylyltransferase/mannose-6-phosphate isomerase [Ramlibacter sp.]|nr:mannose-1-phosphate guanylyltransferase/mannose-6-phosphate isomerase [Ramlibacter sp.]